MKNVFFASICRHWLLLVITIVLLTVVGWSCWNVWPFDRTDMLRSSCTIDGEALLYLRTGKDSVLLSRTPTHRQGVWANRHWWAPSCSGRLLTSVPVIPFFRRYGWPVSQQALREGIEDAADSLQDVLHRREIESKELAYYLRTHGVQDEGYDRIAQYSIEQKRMVDALRKLVHALNAIPAKAPLSLFVVEHDTAVCRDGDGQVMRMPCEPLAWSGHFDRSTRERVSAGNGSVWLRTADHATPSGACAVSLFPWTLRNNERKALTVVILPKDTLLVDNWLQHGRLSQPRMFAPDGASVFTKRGYCLGVSVKKEIVR